MAIFMKYKAMYVFLELLGFGLTVTSRSDDFDHGQIVSELENSVITHDEYDSLNLMAYKELTESSFYSSKVFKPLKLLDTANIKNLFEKKSSFKNIRQGKRLDFRLPLHVLPQSYEIELIPLFKDVPEMGKKWTSPGKVRIKVNCVKPTKIVILHAENLNITSASIQGEASERSLQEIKVLEHRYSTKRLDFYEIHFDRELRKGEHYDISLSFVAPISLTESVGIYRSEYMEPDTREPRYLVSTQFEIPYARRAFPCFDEPALKANFTLTIGRTNQFFSIGNTALETTRKMSNSSDFVWDKFHSSVKMSSYLVAFLVSEYAFIEAEESNFEKPVRVYGPKHSISQGGGNFSANSAAKILSFFQDYFNVDYPLAKMDSAAIPGFQNGAMENFGANFYKPRYIINPPNRNIPIHRQNTVSIVAHELAHQWFGNLVTCKWWDNIWLNEGFATYYSYVGESKLFPEFEGMKRMMIESVQYAFRLDSLDPTSYPLLIDSQDPNEIEDKVFGIPYDKGAAIINMLNEFLTPSTFLKGIRKYLTKWSYDSVEQDDLFTVLNEQGHLDATLPEDVSLVDMMRPWTTQRGFPVVRASLSHNNRVIIQQEPNFIPLSTQAENDEERTWTIPLWIKLMTNDTKFTLLLPNEQYEIYLKGSKHWIVINNEQKGYYRVLYDAILSSNLANAMQNNFEQFSAITRSQILDDHFSFALQRKQPMSSSWDFTVHMGNELENVVWAVLFRYTKRAFDLYVEPGTQGLKSSNTTMKNYDFQEFQTYISSRISQILAKIGVQADPAEPVSISILRDELLKRACRVGVKICLDYVRSLFQSWKGKPKANPIPPNLRSHFYCHGVSIDTSGRTWKMMYYKFLRSQDSFEKFMALSSLGCSANELILEEFLEAGSQGLLSYREFLLLYRSISFNPSSRHVLFKFLRKHIKHLSRAFNDTLDLTLIIKYSTHSMYTEESFEEMKNILEEHWPEGNKRELYFSLESSMNLIKDNMKWMEDHLFAVTPWFRKHNHAPSSKHQPSTN